VIVPECCHEPARLEVIVGTTQSHVVWRCGVCRRRVGRTLSRETVRHLRVHLNALPRVPSPARRAQQHQLRLF
jgi:hypothetical protein